MNGHALARVLRLALVVAAVLAVGWLASGVRQVRSGEQAVEIAGGRVAAVRTTPGLVVSWPPPLAEVLVVPGPDRQLTFEIEDFTEVPGSPAASLLTADGALVHARATLVYAVVEPVDFAVRAAAAEPAMRRAMCAALVGEVSATALPELLAGDGAAVRARLAARTQTWFDRGLPLGIAVRRVDLSFIVPVAAKNAFAAVQDAAAEGSRTVAAAEQRAAWIRQRSRGEADALRREAGAKAAEAVAERRSQLAPVAALRAAIEAGGDREAVLEGHWRDRCHAALQAATRLVLVPPGESVRLGIAPP